MLLAQGRSGDRVVSKQPGQDGEAILESPAVQREFFEESAKTDDSRITPRFTLLIRAAKLICQQGEFICVIRDISSTGVSLRLFHALPRCDSFVLEFQTGHCSKVRNVWGSGREGGFAFLEPIDVMDVINEMGCFPKRGVRLGLEFLATIVTHAQDVPAMVHNLSQQGARIRLDSPLAIDQTVRIKGPGLNEVRSKVRWRRGGEYGLVFDDTFSLGDFAALAARLQCPALLRG